MNIEIVEFYPDPENKGNLFGTLHVYLVDYQMDLRGILVFRKGKNWFFRLPHAWGKNPDTGARVSFPLIAFSDHAKTKCLVQEIMRKGQEYITQKTPSISPKKPKISS